MTAINTLNFVQSSTPTFSADCEESREMGMERTFGTFVDQIPGLTRKNISEPWFIKNIEKDGKDTIRVLAYRYSYLSGVTGKALCPPSERFLEIELEMRVSTYCKAFGKRHIREAIGNTKTTQDFLLDSLWKYDHCWVNFVSSGNWNPNKWFVALCPLTMSEQSSRDYHLGPDCDDPDHYHHEIVTRKPIIDG